MRLENVFIQNFPEVLEGGKLYVSMQYASVAHLCPCGCGSEVVTPLRRDAWRLEFDGENISLSPSVGSRNLACRSHYYITGGRIKWLQRMDSSVLDQEPLLAEEPQEAIVITDSRSILEKWYGWLVFWRR